MQSPLNFEKRFAKANRVETINIAARSFLSRKTPPMLSVSILSAKRLNVYSQTCVYTRCLVYYKLYLPLATSEFSPDNIAAIKLKFTDCGRELVATFNSVVLGLHTLAHVFANNSSQVKFLSSDIDVYASLKKINLFFEYRYFFSTSLNYTKCAIKFSFSLSFLYL